MTDQCQHDYKPVVYHDGKTWIGYPPHDPRRFGLEDAGGYQWRVDRCVGCGHCLFYLEAK